MHKNRGGDMQVKTFLPSESLFTLHIAPVYIILSLSESLGITLSQMSAVHQRKFTQSMFALNKNDGFVWKA